MIKLTLAYINIRVAGTSITLTSLAIVAIAGVALNAILPGEDYEYGNPEPYHLDNNGI